MKPELIRKTNHYAFYKTKELFISVKQVYDNPFSSKLTDSYSIRIVLNDPNTPKLDEVVYRDRAQRDSLEDAIKDAFREVKVYYEKIVSE